MSSVDVKEITLEELMHIRELSNVNGSEKSESYWQRCAEGIADGSLQIFMAWRDDDPAGYALLNHQPKYRVYQQLEISEIQDLNVIPAHRRQGVAAVLIHACEEVIRKRNCTQIGISFGLTKDYGPAQRLYIKLGYVPDGFGVTYDRIGVGHAEMRPVDDDLCLMLIKDLT